MSNNSEIKDDNKSEYEHICFMCHRTEEVAGKMLRLPQGLYICEDCMQKSFDMMSNELKNVDSDEIKKIFENSNISFVSPNIFSGNNAPKIKPKKKEEPKEDLYPKLDINNLVPPHKIKEHLDEYVIGQEFAKKSISVAERFQVGHKLHSIALRRVVLQLSPGPIIPMIL